MRPFLIYLIAMTGVHLLKAYGFGRNYKHQQLTKASPVPEISENDHVLDGEKIIINEHELHQVLMRRFVYYQLLEEGLKKVFLSRLQEFIDDKMFIIKEGKPVREMPVLVSAAAIQLTFGLKEYLLPFYRYIRIFPEEYIADDAFKILAGNVRSNMISVAWKHILLGNANAVDGSNLGLHEMSHALYFQKLVVEEDYAKNFTKDYESLIGKCALAHQDEVKGIRDFYSEYAETNLQEFWAESVELFFEKPRALLETYPDVFYAIKLLLNQNPIHPSNPVVTSKLSFEEKVRKLAGRVFKF
jgi:MtfA peptidase